MVANNEVTPPTALQIPLLEPRIRRDDFGAAVLARREQEAVVVGRGLGGGGGPLRGWGERHDVGFVEGVGAGWEGGEWCCGGEEEVAAEAVVGVDCV